MDDNEKNRSRDAVKRLVEAFSAHETEYTAAEYNETQARTDFISPLLAELGWDLYNLKQLPQSLREVVEEANVSVAEDAPSKRPDYELRLARIRKLFVEAKKPSVNLQVDRAAAFQARRYGYSASLPLVVLTNFRQISVYDCNTAPVVTDLPHVARVAFFSCGDFVDRFDEIWEFLSREVVVSGRFDDRYGHDFLVRGSAPFDELFLEQVRNWRYRLAVDIYAHLPELSARQLTHSVQSFLSRLIFLRICEDRDLEAYEQLREAAGAGFDRYRELMHKADEFYDSGLFDLVTDSRLGTIVSDATLLSVIEELYYPQSPYTFSVVQAEVLGRIYEQFLGEVIAVQDGAVEVTQRPEVQESGGVVPTPRHVVDEIVDRTIQPLIAGKSPEEIAELTVLDMCCGSGVFLLSAFERLCDHYLDWYIADGVEEHRGKTILEGVSGVWRLTYSTRREILRRHIRGVDIDPEAVEVAQLSLLLKLIEGEEHEDLVAFVSETGRRALPGLGDVLRSGNSLIGRNEWIAVMGPIGGPTEEMVRPFDWAKEFSEMMDAGGFSAIVGNPPYIRIQNMAKYSPDEVRYYENRRSPYTTGHQDNFDKYALFIERGLELLAPTGRLGFITPHKFMTITSGRAVRELLAGRVSEIVHFGSQQVFVNRSNYTAVVIVGPETRSPLIVEPVSTIAAWRIGTRTEELSIPRSSLSAEPWRFASQEYESLRERLLAAGAKHLDDTSEIFVGLQTSADDVYMVTAKRTTDEAAIIQWNSRDWRIERSILRPVLHDAPIEAFSQPRANKWIIFPYDIEAGSARLIQPADMETQYPGCWEYLSARRDELEGRNITGGRAADRQWYQYGRSQSLTKFVGPKIVFPILSREPRYALDEDEIRVTGGGNGPYYLLRSAEPAISNEVLLAVLNHPLAEAEVRQHTSVFRGGYYSHGKQFIGRVLVPSSTDVETDALRVKVREVMDAKTQGEAAATPGEREWSERRYEGLRSELMQQVDHLFGLTDEDRRVIDSAPAP